MLFTRQSNKPFGPVRQKKTKTNCEHFSLTYFAKKGRNFDDLIAYFDLFLFDFEIFKFSKFNVPRVRELPAKPAVLRSLFRLILGLENFISILLIKSQAGNFRVIFGQSLPCGLIIPDKKYATILAGG